MPGSSRSGRASSTRAAAGSRTGWSSPGEGRDDGVGNGGNGGDGEDGDDRCSHLLADLGLEASADKLPDQLSGGQRQRVAVARALVHRPALILADELTGSVDAVNAEAVVDLLVGPSGRRGRRWSSSPTTHHWPGASTGSSNCGTAAR